MIFRDSISVTVSRAISSHRCRRTVWVVMEVEHIPTSPDAIIRGWMKAVLKDREAHAFADLSRDQLLAVHRCMLLSRKLDDKEIQLKGQSQIFFQISGAGHEAVLAAAGVTLKPAYDWFFPYYRDRALCLQIGITPYEMLLAAVGARDDPASGGRQMPSHWGHTKYNVVSGSSPTGTQVLHAVGAAEAGVIYSRVPQIADRETRFHEDEITYVSLGEGATSEGEFWEALNVACTKQLPILFLIEDNGYAISVPVEVQTAGGDISRLVRSFPGLHVASIDGTDFFASLAALREAAAYIRGRQGPALVHARVTRPYSHSLSDDEKLYKPPAEREAEAKRDPIARFREFLIERGLAETETLDAVAREVEQDVNEAALQAVAAPRPGKETAELWVYS